MKWKQKYIKKGRNRFYASRDSVTCSRRTEHFHQLFPKEPITKHNRDKQECGIGKLVHSLFVSASIVLLPDLLMREGIQHLCLRSG